MAVQRELALRGVTALDMKESRPDGSPGFFRTEKKLNEWRKGSYLACEITRALKENDGDY